MGAPAYAKRGKVRPIKPTDSVRGAIRWLPSKKSGAGPFLAAFEPVEK
jgi:hypothetical protein